MYTRVINKICRFVNAQATRQHPGEGREVTCPCFYLCPSETREEDPAGLKDEVHFLDKRGKKAGVLPWGSGSEVSGRHLDRQVRLSHDNPLVMGNKQLV